jgi:tetratricopeptide (TPR) repeat protein
MPGRLHLVGFSDQGGNMFSRARAIAPLLIVVASIFTYSQAQVSAAQPNQETVSAFAGKVLNAQGKPASGIHVELDDIYTGLPLSSTFTKHDGTFELYNIPPGNYEVVAESAARVVSNQVSVQPGRRNLELRFPLNSSVEVSAPTVSVARMLVPATAQKKYERAYRCFAQRKYDEADKELEEALEIDPEFAEALTLRGLMMLNGPDQNSARQLFEQSIQIDPSDSAAYIALAALYNHSGRFDDAMRISEKGLSFSPRSWQGYLELAKASIAKDMYQKGLKLLRQAERLGGNTYAEVHLVKAYALVPLKLYKEAKYELQAALVHQHDGRLDEQAKQLLARLDDLENTEIAGNR